GVDRHGAGTGANRYGRCGSSGGTRESSYEGRSHRRASRGHSGVAAKSARAVARQASPPAWVAHAIVEALAAASARVLDSVLGTSTATHSRDHRGKRRLSAAAG